MINNITITNHLGDVLVINMKNPEQSGFFIQGITGLGPPKATINMTEVLPVDGSFFNSARVTNRNIVMHLGFHNDNALSVEQIRRKSYRHFPIKRLVEIKIETDTRTAKTMGYVESNDPDIFSNSEGAIVSIVCPNAYLTGEDSIETIFSGYIPLFEFPFENPSLTEPLIEFGTVILNTEQTVLYSGDAETGIKITVYFLGNVNNLSIYNLTRHQIMAIDSNKLIALTGSDFIEGDRLLISTIQREKYIRLIRAGETINILNTLDSDADWFTVDYGDNLFLFQADSGSNNVQFMIEHTPIYEGV